MFALESIWAYLPVGPLERQFEEEYQGGDARKWFVMNPQERDTFSGRTFWESLC
jgi:hypothetical protein